MHRVKYRNNEWGKAFLQSHGAETCAMKHAQQFKNIWAEGSNQGKALEPKTWGGDGCDVSWVREQTCLSRMANLPSLQYSTVVTTLILACFLNLCDSKPSGGGVLFALSKVLKTIVPSRRSYWLPELHQLLQRYVHEHSSLRCLGKCDMYRGRKLTESVVFFFLKLRNVFQ